MRSISLRAVACALAIAGLFVSPAHAEEKSRGDSSAAATWLPIVPVDPDTGLPYLITGGGGGGGAGTEYTEDAAAPANPIGPTLNCRRRDTLSVAEVSLDGDWIACVVTSKGQLHTYAEIGGLLPGFASPPTVNLGTIAGVATAAKQPALGTAGAPSADVLTVQGSGSGTPIPVTSSTLATVAAQTTAQTSFTSIDNALGGSAAAVAGTTGASTTNGFLRFIRDYFQGGTLASSANQTALNGKVDTTNTNLTSALTKLDTANTNLTSALTKLDTAITNLAAIKTAAESSTPADINNKQIGGVAMATSIGAPDTGTQRVALAMQGTTDPVSVSTAATVQIHALTSGKRLWVTAWDLVAAGTTNGTWVYGTGTNCATGTTALTGAYPLIAQVGVAKGAGTGAVLTVPAGNALCFQNGSAILVAGSAQVVVEP